MHSSERHVIAPGGVGGATGSLPSSRSPRSPSSRHSAATRAEVPIGLQPARARHDQGRDRRRRERPAHDHGIRRQRPDREHSGLVRALRDRSAWPSPPRRTVPWPRALVRRRRGRRLVTARRPSRDRRNLVPVRQPLQRDPRRQPNDGRRPATDEVQSARVQLVRPRLVAGRDHGSLSAPAVRST